MKKHKKTVIGLFGGSFNPITKYHMNVVESILKTKIVDKIWFMPANKHNLGKKLPEAFHRSELIYTAIGSHKLKEKMDVCCHEILTGSDGKAYNTIKELINLNPNTSFHYIIGGDVADQIVPQWYRGEELIKMIPFIVVQRDGIEWYNNDQWYTIYPHMVLDLKIGNGSSTLARKAIETNNQEEMAKYLNKDVIEYIYRNELYKIEEKKNLNL